MTPEKVLKELKYNIGVQDKECSTAALGCDFFFRTQPRAAVPHIPWLKQSRSNFQFCS